MSLRIRPMSPADYPALVAMRNLEQESPLHLEPFARGHDPRPDGQPRINLVAEEDGAPLGYAEGGYDSEMGPGALEAYLFVHPAQRGRGVGRALWQALQPFYQEHRPTQLQSWVRDNREVPLAWAERLGYERTDHIFRSQVDLAAFDPAPFQAGLQRLQAQGIRFVPFSELRSPAAEARFCDLFNAAAAATPDDSPWVPWSLENWRAQSLEDPSAFPDGCLVALDGTGEWVGLLQVQRNTADPQRAHIWMTGVVPAWRGQGLGLALKVAAHERARALGLRYLSTNNHSRNQPMLAVNNKLGYQKVNGSYRMVRPYAAPVRLRARSSYILDALNLFSILTGHEFYTSRHPEEWAWWQERLSPDAHARLAEAQAIHGSHMLGPILSLLISAVPDFDRQPVSGPVSGPLPALLADTQRVLTHYQHYPYYDPETWLEHERLLQTLAPVAEELEQLGLAQRWREVQLPKVEAGIATLKAFLATFDFDLGQAVAGMLGAGAPGANEDIQVYISEYCKPHGIKICGRQFVSHHSWDPKITLRVAIHEMFHPPYAEAEVQAELAALIADPLFQDCFTTKDPTFGYSTEVGFLEENVVEAITVYLGGRAGVVDDPVGYLAGREGGVYRMAVVLYAAMERLPKVDAAEPFGTYFKRLVAQMDVGNLNAAFAAEMAARPA